MLPVIRSDPRVPSISHRSEQTYGPVIAAITQLLDAGKRDGTIRTDADPGDFLHLTGALWRAPSGPDDPSQRILALILDGLRGRPEHPAS